MSIITIMVYIIIIFKIFKIHSYRLRVNLLKNKYLSKKTDAAFYLYIVWGINCVVSDFSSLVIVKKFLSIVAFIRIFRVFIGLVLWDSHKKILIGSYKANSILIGIGVLATFIFSYLIINQIIMNEEVKLLFCTSEDMWVVKSKYIFIGLIRLIPSIRLLKCISKFKVYYIHELKITSYVIITSIEKYIIPGIVTVLYALVPNNITNLNSKFNLENLYNNKFSQLDENVKEIFNNRIKNNNSVIGPSSTNVLYIKVSEMESKYNNTEIKIKTINELRGIKDPYKLEVISLYMDSIRNINDKELEIVWKPLSTIKKYYMDITLECDVNTLCDVLNWIQF